MAQSLSSFRKKHIIEVYKQVKSLRETSLLTKTTRNTVRAVLRASKIDGHLIAGAIATSESMKELEKIPVLNPESKWNPLQSEVYRRLKKIEPIGPLEPGCVKFITNTSTLITSIAEELQIGDSVVATLKLDMLMSSYIEYPTGQSFHEFFWRKFKKS